MLKQLAWNTFKNTGNIYTMLELLEVNNMEHDNINNLKNLNIKQTDVKNIKKK